MLDAATAHVLKSAENDATEVVRPAASGRPWLALLALAAANALWGASFLLGKLALVELAPAHVVFWRFAIAGAILLPTAAPVLRRMRRRDIPHFLLAGVLLVPVMMLVQVEGLRRTSATHAALIIGTIPVLMAVAAVVVDRERVGRLTWLAAVVSTGGMAWIVLSAGNANGAHDGVGDLMILASAVAAVVWTLVTRRLLRRYAAVGVTALCVGIGTLALVPIMVVCDGAPPLPATTTGHMAILGLGVGCTAITYGLWNWGLRHVRTSQAGVLVNLEPLIGALLGIWLLNEPAGPGVYLGGGCILIAAITAAVAKPEAAAAADASRLDA